MKELKILCDQILFVSQCCMYTCIAVPFPFLRSGNLHRRKIHFHACWVCTSPDIGKELKIVPLESDFGQFVYQCIYLLIFIYLKFIHDMFDNIIDIQNPNILEKCLWQVAPASPCSFRYLPTERKNAAGPKKYVDRSHHCSQLY